MSLAKKKVVAANSGRVERTVLGNPGRLPVDRYGLVGLVIGLLAGLGITLGLPLVPPRWRTTFAARARARTEPSS